MAQIFLKYVKAIGLDETASKRCHNYVTVFIDLDRDKDPVLFATPGQGKQALQEFRQFLEDRGGKVDKLDTFMS
ncbi:MAG TPA: hypothetical protein ENH34_05285 [Phycisphaerales bacterium]|nr:hypothetical protein [Phycisphaerales bacterium]